MRKLGVILTFTICSMSINAQELKQKGPHGGDVYPLDDFQIEMVKKHFTCLSHPKIIGQENDICTKCEASLERESKIEFYFLNENFNELDTSNLKGRVRIVFNDETETSKKIRISEDVIWVPLGNEGYNSFQQAIVNVELNNKKYKATFGHPMIHKGHHH